MIYTTPLRYPGGKRRLSNFVKKIFEQNDLMDGHYIEPYAGGAGIAFDLLFNEYASHIHINDLNKSIHAFWLSVLNNTEELCRLINDAPLTIEYWRGQRELQKASSNCSAVELGFSTLYLNRTNRSGIIGGGVIGGLEQNGKWKIDARFNKAELIKRIKKIARYNRRIFLYNIDACDFIKDILPQLPGKALVYLDPPYYVKGKGLYESHYLHGDHQEVSVAVANDISQKWIVSYDNVPEIKRLYSQFRSITYSLSYSAQARYQGDEIMFFCNEINIPAVYPILTRAI